MKQVSITKNMEKLLRSSFGKEMNQENKKINFGMALKNAIDKVDHLDKAANQHAAMLAEGKEKDIHQTMIALEKADVSFKLIMQVRNKIIDAYKQIERMQV